MALQQLPMGLLMLVILITETLGCGQPAIKPEQFSQFSMKRQQAEHWIGKLKKDYDPLSLEHAKAEQLYVDASTAVNSWLDTLQYVDALGGPNNDHELKKIQDEAANKVDKLLGFLNNLFHPQFHPAIAAAVAIQALDAITLNYLKMRRENKSEAKKFLEAERWKLFPDIPRSK